MEIDDDENEIAPAIKSKPRAPPEKDGDEESVDESVDMDMGSSSEEGEEDDSDDDESSEEEFDMGMDPSDLVKDEKERKWLDSLTELEREDFLNKKFEERKAKAEMKRALKTSK